MKKNFLFTSESVSEGHPDKVADQISDAIIDHFLAFDPKSKVACETLVTTGQVILAVEVKSKTYLDKIFLEITSFCISLVPSPIVHSFESLKYFSTGKSLIYP